MTTDTALKPHRVGLKWALWTALVVTVAILAPRITRLDVNAFAVWLLNLVIFGGLAFVAGFIYGKFRTKDKT